MTITKQFIKAFVDQYMKSSDSVKVNSLTKILDDPNLDTLDMLSPDSLNEIYGEGEGTVIFFDISQWMRELRRFNKLEQSPKVVEFREKYNFLHGKTAPIPQGSTDMNFYANPKETIQLLLDVETNENNIIN